jgi:GH24 family phage-related lysozyme (muramidase)
MTTPAPVETTPPAGAGRLGFVGASAAAVMLLWAALIGSEQREYVPYLDVFGVLTVCAGITGPEVIAGRTYSDTECDALEHGYITRMLARMGECVKRSDLALHQVIAWGHFAYNVGNAGFCKSTAASYLNSKRDKEACDQIMRWTFGTSRRTGNRIDCAVRANRCYGLYDRRLRERAMCNGDMDAFKPGWSAAA